jgi:hypothetical protein
MLLRCSNPQCGRVRVFRVHEIRDHWRKKRWNDRWKDLPQHFRCAICRSRPSFPQWIENASDMPDIASLRACLAPYGINPLAWALASASDRERLIKARR